MKRMQSGLKSPDLSTVRIDNFRTMAKTRAREKHQEARFCLEYRLCPHRRRFLDQVHQIDSQARGMCKK